MGGGGIPVIIKERGGGSTPAAGANGKGRKNAETATGQNIGRKTEPSPAAWKKMGRRMPVAINRAHRIKFRVLTGYLCMVPLQRKTDFGCGMPSGHWIPPHGIIISIQNVFH